ncbi:hypothetical protein EVAR_55647_1 [Eumeta japonica]|uniref:Uncharacterized protein n=1 Tax=Eumeta variegata TaxID=151549 RepID=A0A4C1Y0L5_EUMVA|nr:hypothetical protein EVAR_55647_1 [Eumeta japonica]
MVLLKKKPKHESASHDRVPYRHSLAVSISVTPLVTSETGHPTAVFYFHIEGFQSESFVLNRRGLDAGIGRYYQCDGNGRDRQLSVLSEAQAE